MKQENKYQEALQLIENKYPCTIENPCINCAMGHCYVKDARNTLQELVDKETPLKPVEVPSDSDFIEYKKCKCPKCGTLVYFADNQHDYYCHTCGQKIDWR